MTAHRVVRSLDAIATSSLVVGALYLGLRVPVPGKYDPIIAGPRAVVAYLMVAVLVAVLVRVVVRCTSGGWRWMARGTGYFIALIVVGMMVTRLRLAAQVAASPDPWPPRLELIRSNPVDSLTPEHRAEWALRVGSHRLSGADVRLEIPMIPLEWPFPNDVTMAIRPVGATRVELWTRASGAATACALLPLRRKPDLDTAGAQCPQDHKPPPVSDFHRAVRGPASFAPVIGNTGDGAWLQYRGDAERSARRLWRGAAGESWITRIDGEIRSSASVVGNFVLVGAHGTGTLAALDRMTGQPVWVTRVPNWVHQDPVSDGRTLLVGFGDNLASFAGRAPSGVAAIEVATGRHLWTGFDEGSVMTSPVIRDSVLVYGTGAGILRTRSLATGRVLDEAMLPGMVTMAPPASRGDTAVFTLDYNRVCAISIATLDAFWCRTMPHLRMMGHAAPTIYEGSVIVSGVGTLFTPSLREFGRLPRRLQLRLVSSAVFPTSWDEPSGQVFASLRLRDGAMQWTSPLFANPRLVVGHVSGTAAVDSGIGIIVLPVSDTVVSFNPATGAIRWSVGALGARGPPLVVAGHVVVAGREGIIEVRDIDQGLLTCVIRRKVGWDRAGPTLTGSLLVLGDLKGTVEAIPIAKVLSCDTR